MTLWYGLFALSAIAASWIPFALEVQRNRRRHRIALGALAMIFYNPEITIEESTAAEGLLVGNMDALRRDFREYVRSRRGRP